MSEQAHTPGPWIVADHVARIGYNDRYLVVTAPATRWVALVMEGGEADEEDARLIAAAPDLLEALEHYVAIEDRCRIENEYITLAELDECLSAARAAIAKATGQ